MTRLATACVVALATIVAASGFAVQTNTTDPLSLEAAIEDFNQQALADPIGTSQPSLTEEEVIAAIRGWIPENTPGVTDEIYGKFQEIAESRVLPNGADLSFCSGWTGYRGYSFEVWWIDLSIKTGENTGYTFRIRDQKLSSRKMTPKELAEIEQRNQGAMPK
jgi:hypothetical protein